MSGMKNELVNAALSRFQSQKLEGRANLLVYLSNPTGIGEHPNVVEEVVKLTKQIAEAEECIDILRELGLGDS